MQSGSHFRPAARTRAAFLILALTALLFPSPANASAATDVDIRPAPGPHAGPNDGYFKIPVQRGTSLSAAVEVSNPGDSSVDVRLAPVDGETAQTGGVSYSDEQPRLDRAGRWIRLTRDRVTLAPGERALVPFTVSIPAKIRSGIHLAGISAWTPDEDQEIEENATNVALRTRKVIAVELSISGSFKPKLAIRGASAGVRHDGLYLLMDLFNEGRNYLKGEGTTSIQGVEAPIDFSLGTVVPGTGTHYPVKWSDEGVPQGEYEVEVRIDYGVDVVKWRGLVTVGDVIAEDLTDRGIATAPDGSLRWLIAGLIVLALVASILLRRRMKARRSSAAPPLPPVRVSTSVAAPPPPPAPAVVEAPRPPPSSPRPPGRGRPARRGRRSRTRSGPS